MKQRQIVLLISALLSAQVMAQTEGESDGPVPDPAWAQAWLDQGYLPRQQALTQAADQLASSSAALCAAPDNAKLNQARSAWQATSTAWRALDGAPAGPMVLARLGRKIDFRPVRVAELEAAINGGASNVATQGLAAAEYLLWGDAQPKTILATLKNPTRCEYLVKTSKAIALETHTLDDGWRIYREELGAENPFFRQNMFSEHVNLMLASLTGLAKRMPTAETVNAEQFAEWRSNSAKAQLLAQLSGFATAMQGVNRQLNESGSKALAQKMQSDISAAQNECGKLPDALDKASSKARMNCNKAIVQLKKRLQDEIAEKLDLSLGFTEGDGD
ncbi:hypothetical protein NT239_10765 [Chitinibacter sp. SCUT-21]|uniref:imelysin family protein n=1 Tax=Chitinibacter sp. SCUT-21 TaxID=2970891 RepID=UPI0035A61C06